MVNHDHQCRACGKVFDAVVAWDKRTIACECGGTADRIFRGSSVIDDTLPGGARWMHNLGDQPVWVETKTQYSAELKARGLVQAERASYNKNDQSPYATRTRLRPGARDPFLEGAR